VRPVILIVLDGWGINPQKQGNAQLLAKTPFISKIFKEYPYTELETSGLSVGLPKGQMGNSEVGHLTMGAGRIFYQDLTRINKEIETGAFFKNKIILESMSSIKKKNSALHLMGLVSDGGVHSHINHLFALLDMAKQNGLNSIIVPKLNQKDLAAIDKKLSSGLKIHLVENVKEVLDHVLLPQSIKK